MPLFRKIDFSAYVNRNLTIRIALLDDRRQWLTPPFTTGYFAIAPLAIAPIQQGSVPAIFSRNTNGFNCRFTNLIDPPDITGPEWFLDSDILPSDTVGLSPNTYYYEARLDWNGGQYPLKAGYFNLVSTIL